MKKRVPQVLTLSEVRRRKRGLKGVLNPYYRSAAECDRAADAFAARGHTADKVSARLERMKIAGVPLTGLQWKVGGSQARFEGIVRRYEDLQGLTQRQAVLVYNLRKKGVSNAVIQALVRTRVGRGNRYHWPRIKAKIDYLESIELDPAIYGTDRLKVADYECILPWPLARIKKGIQKQVLMPLEDRHVGKRLDGILPGWRESKSLRQQWLRPGTILRKCLAARKMGLKQTIYLLRNYSVEEILAGRARTNRPRPRKGSRANRRKLEKKTESI